MVQTGLEEVVLLFQGNGEGLSEKATSVESKSLKELIALLGGDVASLLKGAPPFTCRARTSEAHAMRNRIQRAGEEDGRRGVRPD